jgi:uncharacterized phage-like protein YoqJ
MVTIPREFNMDHLKFHLIMESEEMDNEWNKRNRRSQEEMKEVLWYFMYIKERYYEKTIRKHMSYGERGIQ